MMTIPDTCRKKQKCEHRLKGGTVIGGLECTEKWGASSKNMIELASESFNIPKAVLRKSYLSSFTSRNFGKFIEKIFEH